jgi:hypothetical protein
MLKGVKKDIMNHIYSFGYPQHRNYMKRLSYEMDTNLTGYNITPKEWPKYCSTVNHCVPF